MTEGMARAEATETSEAWMLPAATSNVVEGTLEEPKTPLAVVVGDLEEGAVAEAVPVAPETRTSEVPEAPIVHQAVVAMKDRPRTACTSLGCCITLLILLLVFLLMPRAPSIRLRSVDVSGTTRLVFESRSLTDTDWKRLDLDLEWRSEDSTVEVGRLTRSESFSTSAFGERSLNIETKDIDLIHGPMLAATCAQDGRARLRVVGDVRSESTRIGVSSVWEFVACD